MLVPRVRELGVDAFDDLRRLSTPRPWTTVNSRPAPLRILIIKWEAKMPPVPSGHDCSDISKTFIKLPPWMGKGVARIHWICMSLYKVDVLEGALSCSWLRGPSPFQRRSGGHLRYGPFTTNLSKIFLFLISPTYLRLTLTFLLRYLKSARIVRTSTLLSNGRL